MPKKSPMERNAVNPLRTQRPAIGCQPASTVELMSDAASRIVPAAVTHDRSADGDRKKLSSGCDVCVSSSSANQSW